MKFRLLAALAALVLLPLGLLSWLGFRAAGEEYGALERTFRTLVQERLSDLDGRVAGFMADRRDELRRAFDPNTASGAEFMELARRHPFVTQVFAQALDGRLTIPAPDTPLTEGERAFLTRTQLLFDRKVLLAHVPEHGSGQETTGKTRMQYSASRYLDLSWDERSPGRVEDGWYSWFGDTDIRLVYWRRTPERGVIGGEINRIGLLSGLVGMLPETTSGDPVVGSGALILADSQGRTLYRWGTLASGAVPLETLSLTPPLRSWSLQFVAPADTFRRRFHGGIRLQVWAGLAAIALTLSGLAWFLYREHARDLREAEQRVTFVNQVSHELKTPLTNIRMYAELLGEALPEDDPESHRRLEVIVTESRRLGRLIANVLTFSKRRKGQVEARFRTESVDQRILAVVDSFRPALELRALAVELDLGASPPAPHDPDLLEQILGNLIGNVEKYAATGGRLIVRSRMREKGVGVWVRDFGPGIPRDKCELVFEPFTRLSEAVDEGVSGTGIGLTIARDLARIHGGDLTIVFSNGALGDDLDLPEPESSAGCCFRLLLATSAPAASSQERSRS